ncbi:hypothetical protein ACFOSD_03570 [Salinispirillum marinum]|uniref:DinB-like domain-containing protein n=2 Tax=Saccharospirillaceae TaxID=255527 RepID=A0ABV8BDW7_9GAMM
MLRYSISRLIFAGTLFMALIPVALSQPAKHSHSEMQHLGAPAVMDTQQVDPMPLLNGQDAFAAVQEIVTLLQQDSSTDWSRVDIDALRDHLIDMHLVTLDADVDTEYVASGARYVIRSDAPRTAAAIQRMVTAHALWMQANSPWSAETTRREDGVVLRVTAEDSASVLQIRGLGFMGFMTYGNHHQPHHWAMARGEEIHEH